MRKLAKITKADVDHVFGLLRKEHQSLSLEFGERVVGDYHHYYCDVCDVLRLFDERNAELAQEEA